MSLSETIKKMGPPIASNLRPNERAPVEQAPPPKEREPGKSALGASEEFSSYYAGGGFDKESGQNKGKAAPSGSRFHVVDSFKEAAEGYKPHIVVKAHSRFGPVGKQMLEAHPAKNADTGAYEKARDLYLHSEDGGKAFEIFINSLSEEQRQFISDKLDEEGSEE